MQETKSLFKSQETKSENWIMYPFNSYSSLFYLIILEQLFKNENNFINNYGIVVTILLTISSFFWWGRRNKYIQIIDINSYSLLIFFVGFYYLYNNLEDSKEYVKILMIIITFLVILTLYIL